MKSNKRLCKINTLCNIAVTVSYCLAIGLTGLAVYETKELLNDKSSTVEEIQWEAIPKECLTSNLYAGFDLEFFGEQVDYNLDAIRKRLQEEKEESNYIEEYGEPLYVRCTGYDDIGYTKSGEWTRPGGVAGKLEWLGKKCYIYEVDDTGDCGELIGVYTFNDTGFGLKKLDGVYYEQGTIKAGKSIDIWHESLDAVWEWAAEHGDYVYIQVV